MPYFDLSLEPRLVALAAVFTVWWAISAANQYRVGAWTVRLRRQIPLSLIPLWTFFAPNPARADSRLVWREEGDDGWGGWRELHFGYAPVRSRWLVNPELIQNKAVTDLVNSLLRVRPEGDERTTLLSAAYVTLLSLVVAQPRAAGCAAVQFAIVRTSRVTRERRVAIAFVSEVHALADQPDLVCR
jgi:hypothetical protein